MKTILVLILSILLLTACLPGQTKMQQSPFLPFLERKSGLIAYIGADGNIYTSDQAGGNKVAHTTDAMAPADESSPFRFYFFPTWSRDSASLGFAGLSGEGTSFSSEIFIASLEEERTEKVFNSDSEQPVYLYWSPNNTDLSLISSTADRQSLILQSVSSGSDDRRVIDTGTPYYWSWAPDGRTMIVHSGSSLSSVPNHLAFLQIPGEEADIVEQNIETLPAAFQSPAWSPDGSRILMARLNDENKNEIIVTDSQGELEQVIDSYDLNAAFAWSNNSDMVAYIEGEQVLGAGILGTMHVYDLEASEQVFDVENVYAFFWSPNDRKIAYFTPQVTTAEGQQQQIVLQMRVGDLSTGESQELITFRPTQQFANILPYFDQYHQSATIWSPDSSNLVFSFLTSDSQAGIAVISASGQLEPRLLAPGFLAFWSWE